MPYTTLVAGTVITASWANASVRDQSLTPFANSAARTSAITSPVEGMLSYRVDGKTFEGYDGVGWTMVPFTTLKIKSADETVTSSTTLQDDNELAIAVRADAAYRVELHLVYSSGTTPDFKFGWSYPSGATMAVGAYETFGGTFNGFAQVETDTPPADGLAANEPLWLTGALFTSSTAGTLTFRWAQNTSDPGNTIVRKGSYLALTRAS